MIRKICLKPIFILKLYAMKLEADCRHLAFNQIKKREKNADKMATKMAVYNKKYKNIFPETGKLQEFACKILFY